MKGDKEVIEVLNEVLAGELVAINQYFLHAKMCANWGFKSLASKVRAESIDEMKHADAIVERVLFLEGLPNLQRLDKLHVGQTVVEQLKSDLALEMHALKRLRDGIAICRDHADRTSWKSFSSRSSARKKNTSTGSRPSSASSNRSARSITSRSSSVDEGKDGTDAEDPGRRRPAQHADDARDHAPRRGVRGRGGERRGAGRRDGSARRFRSRAHRSAHGLARRHQCASRGEGVAVEHRSHRDDRLRHDRERRRGR